MMKHAAATSLPDDLLWGAEAISKYINRSRSATYYLIAKGKIPAKKLGARTIAALRSELDRALAALLVEGGDDAR
jgi:hypothetical protein